MVANKKVAKAVNRRQSLERQIQLAAQHELDTKIEAELSDPQTRKMLQRLQKQLQSLADPLHRKRVLVKRKEFALKVRHERLANIPKEIEAITKDRDAHKKLLQKLEHQSQHLQDEIDTIRSKAIERLRGRGEKVDLVEVGA